MPNQKYKWIMPDWMKPYEKYFNNTGGNKVEDLMNREGVTIVNNAPLTLCMVACEAQVGLLMNLYDKGELV